MTEPTEDAATGDGNGDADEGPSTTQFVAPIAGLLSIVFAVMAGASLQYALSGPTELLLVPAGLAAASVGALYLKRKVQSPSGDADA
ncbi:hypothetical protein HWV07_15850 [Natronomonas salina]|uniref:hypothetical protein n=1 Tax=Natronomonas salina TaxID=1710540 RepID=UPI0015B5DAC4|nr:hypothetical protein [Natronomonas salina]QLD87500.1 hypothetical protein HWV07_15850 [Natronomonas salina]